MSVTLKQNKTKIAMDSIPSSFLCAQLDGQLKIGPAKAGFDFQTSQGTRGWGGLLLWF